MYVLNQYLHPLYFFFLHANKLMKISFWSIGKAHDEYVKEGVHEFTKRISKYFPVEWNIIPAPKNAGQLSETDLKRKEGEILLQLLKPEHYLVALDEKGKQLSSVDLSRFLEQRSLDRSKNIVFLIGGAFGLDEQVLKATRLKWSLSHLTFPHQLVRLILAEQVYRACTILNNEKYHHI